LVKALTLRWTGFGRLASRLSCQKLEARQAELQQLSVAEAIAQSRFHPKLALPLRNGSYSNKWRACGAHRPTMLMQRNSIKRAQAA
jgi:hypothetical protein